MHTGTKLADALSRLVGSPLAHTYSRVVTTATLLGMTTTGAGGPAVVTRLSPNLLYAGGPTLVGGRYTPVGGPEALYLGSSERVANAKRSSGLAELFPGRPLPPKTVFQARVIIKRALDLSVEAIQMELGTNDLELNSPWRPISNPPTHILGLAIHQIGLFSAIRYRSTKESRGYCVVIFPDRLTSGESVEVVDPAGYFSWSPLVGS
jgi:hypothetical protein